jgi:hypothetical protein
MTCNGGERIYDDEIDLYGLWLVLKKRRIIIFLTVVGCLAVGIAYTALAPKVYRVSDTLVLNQNLESIKQGELTAAVADLDRLRNNHKRKAAELLGMNADDLVKIKSIKASEIKGSSVIRVDIETFDTSAGVALMEALPGYIQSVPSIAINLDMEKALMKKNVEDLKVIIDNPVKDLNLPSNTVVYVPSIDLYTLREKYNRLLMVMESIEGKPLVSLAWKAEPPLKPFKPKIALDISLSLIMGTFLGTFLALLLEWATNARKI